MKKIILAYLFLFSATLMFAQAPTAAWINEFHYDNSGSGENEFIEVVVDSSFHDLIDLKVYFYNGADSMISGSSTLNSFIEGSTQFGFTIYYKETSLQDGPDGFVLAYNDTLVIGQFISYEGTILAKDGPAQTRISTDIGFSEDNDNPPEHSIGLSGNGTKYSDFTWTEYAIATPGAPNTTQALPVELTSFTANIFDNNIELNWQTATEINNFGFDIQRKTKYSGWQKIGFVHGFGTTNIHHNYFYTDKNLKPGIYSYHLKQIDTDGKSEYSKTLTVKLKNNLTFELKQNYPNPFNPVTKITYSIPQKSYVSLKVFNILGEVVANLVHEKELPGKYSVVLSTEDYTDLTSGIYFYSLHYKNFIETKKMIVLK